MKPKEVHAVAQGRVWSGRAAKEAGLVDELGGLSDAIGRAKRDAGLDEDTSVQIVQLPRPRPSLLRLLGVSSEKADFALAEPIIRKLSLNPWVEILKSGASGTIMAQMPYVIEIE